MRLYNKRGNIRSFISLIFLKSFKVFGNTAQTKKVLTHNWKSKNFFVLSRVAKIDLNPDI